jgi:CRP-like cAMP-binding protein
MKVIDWLPGICAGRWYASLPGPLQQALLETGQLRSVPGGAYLYRRGDPSAALYCVLVGAIKVSTVSAEGREAVLAFIEPYHWFGEIGLIDGGPRTHDGIAVQPSVLLEVPGTPLAAWLEQHPAGWRALAQLACQKLRLSFGAIEELSLLPAPVRLARRLLLMRTGYGETPDTRATLRVSQEQLAMMLALSRQTVNLELKRLERDGLVRLAPGAVQILDEARLRRFASG